MTPCQRHEEVLKVVEIYYCIGSTHVRKKRRDFRRGKCVLWWRETVCFAARHILLNAHEFFFFFFLFSFFILLLQLQGVAPGMGPKHFKMNRKTYEPSSNEHLYENSLLFLNFSAVETFCLRAIEILFAIVPILSSKSFSKVDTLYSFSNEFGPSITRIWTKYVNETINQVRPWDQTNLVPNSIEKLKPGSLVSLKCMFPESNGTKFWCPSFQLQNSGILQTRMDQRGYLMKINFENFVLFNSGNIQCTLRKIKKPGFTFSIKLRINSKIFRIISRSKWASFTKITF